MIDNLSEEQRNYHVFALLNAERDAFRARIVETELREAFTPELDSGLIKLIPIDVNYYPEHLVFSPCKMTEGFGDKLMRVIWRSKQVRLKRRKFYYIYLCDYSSIITIYRHYIPIYDLSSS
jgi:hypothetical protein